MTLLLALILGLLQGVRHAFEPDHVVAVSVLISEQRATRDRTRYAVSRGSTIAPSSYPQQPEQPHTLADMPPQMHVVVVKPGY